MLDYLNNSVMNESIKNTVINNINKGQCATYSNYIVNNIESFNIAVMQTFFDYASMFIVVGFIVTQLDFIFYLIFQKELKIKILDISDIIRFFLKIRKGYFKELKDFFDNPNKDTLKKYDIKFIVKRNPFDFVFNICLWGTYFAGINSIYFMYF